MLTDCFSVAESGERSESGAYELEAALARDVGYPTLSSALTGATVLGVLGIISIPDFINRMRLRWIGRNIPRGDAKWIGGLLAQLKPEQIQNAFRAAGYDNEHNQAYSAVVKKRIADLGKL